MLEEILLVHHSHTDVGYTVDQPTLWDLQRRFLDTAVDLGDPDEEGPSAFRWTVETTAPLLEWLETAPPERVARLQELEAAGHLEVTGMLANVTPLYGPAETVESLRPLRTLREEYGFDVRHAMNADVNGQNWPLADALLDAGVEGFSMAVNEHFGGAPLSRPDLFAWEAPSGRPLPTLNGFHYATGYQLGVGRDAEAFADEWWPRLCDHLDRVGWDHSVLPVQTYHPFGDNAPAYDGFAPFVREWNARGDVADGDLPRLRLATPADFWETVDVDDLPVYRGDWTDFWNFGAGSSARETAVNRESRRRLHAADALAAGLDGLGRPLSDRPPARRSERAARAEAWWNLALYDEHTWGADVSVAEPGSEDARAQWYQKAGYAYDARAHSQRLQRDALAELARHVGGDTDA